MLSILSGFVQSYFYDSFLSKTNFAFLTICFGYSLFMELADLGLGRIFYFSIREKFIKRKDVSLELESYVFLYSVITIIVLIAFITTVFLASYLNEIKTTFSTLTLVVFSVNTVLSLIFNFYRNVMFAIEKYMFFDILDVIRKLGLVFSLVFLYTHNSFFLTNLSMSILILAILLILVVFLFRTNNLSFKRTRTFSRSKDIIVSYRNKALKYFRFNLNILIIYNCGFLIFPFFLPTQNIIQFGLFYRISFGVTMVIVAVSDLYIHKLTRSYIQEKYIKSRIIFKQSLLVSCVMVTIGFAVFYLNRNVIFHYWVSAEYVFSTKLNLALYIFFIGRCFQYTSTNFLSSIGHFTEIVTASYFTLFVTLTFVISMCFLDFKLSDIMLVFSLIILLDGLFNLKATFFTFHEKTI